MDRVLPNGFIVIEIFGVGNMLYRNFKANPQICHVFKLIIASVAAFKFCYSTSIFHKQFFYFYFFLKVWVPIK